ncbi:hypothetical protein Nmel_008228 [Mimus melanotis]
MNQSYLTDSNFRNLKCVSNIFFSGKALQYILASVFDGEVKFLVAFSRSCQSKRRNLQISHGFCQLTYLKMG